MDIWHYIIWITSSRLFITDIYKYMNTL